MKGEPVKTEVSKRLLRLALFFAFTIAVVAFTALRIVHPFAMGPRKNIGLNPNAKAKARELLLEGVGTQVSLASKGAGLDQVGASVESVRNFIADRSGLNLDPDVAEKLATIEHSTLNGSSARISCNDLSDAALAILVDRFRSSSDSELEKAADELLNVKVSQKNGAQSSQTRQASKPGSRDVRASAKDRGPDSALEDRVMLRADGEGVMRRADLIEQAKQYRMRLNVPTQMIAILGLVRPTIRQAFQKRLTVLSQALPEQWGEAESKGLTPVQAYLLTYSVASDDPLYRSNQGLQTAMQWVEAVNQRTGSSYPSSTGRLPYGANGYLFSSPVNLLLDKQTTNRLLDRLTERTSK